MADVTKISPAQRAQNFSQLTRQHWQTLPAVAGAENSTVQITLPKVRLLSKIRLMFSASLNMVHAANNTFTAAPFAPFNFVRNVRVEANNGFTPFNLSGMGAYLLNLTRSTAETLIPVVGANAAASRMRNRLGTAADTAANGGADNVVNFMLDLPLTLNDRDPVGLILAQNEETVITVTIDFADADVIFGAAAGFTGTISNVTVFPMIETFSIPAIPEAFPDLSILKICQEKNEAIAGAGVATMKLPVGMTYRKMILYLTDANGGVADAAVVNDIEIVLNQADTPYRIRPAMLASINSEQYGQALPTGVWVFDFTYQGLANYGGIRDYVDTERLTEFWVRLNAAAAGNLLAVYECTSKLRTA